MLQKDRFVIPMTRRRLARTFGPLALLPVLLGPCSGCGSDQPSTGTTAGESEEAAESARAQVEFMKKQRGAHP